MFKFLPFCKLEIHSYTLIKQPQEQHTYTNMQNWREKKNNGKEKGTRLKKLLNTQTSSKVIQLYKSKWRFCIKWLIKNSLKSLGFLSNLASKEILFSICKCLFILIGFFVFLKGYTMFTCVGKNIEIQKIQEVAGMWGKFQKF